MRPVPSLVSRYGFTPTGGALDARVRTLRGLSAVGSKIGDQTLQRGWEKGIQSYADAVWGAVRVLQDAGAAQRKVYALVTNTTTDTPANAAPYEAAVRTILDRYNPASENVQRAIQKGEKGAGWVTWRDLDALANLVGTGINWVVPQGDSAAFDRAKKAKEALLAHLSSVVLPQRATLMKAYPGRAMKVGESSEEATTRFAREDAMATAPAAAAPSPAAAVSTPTAPAPAASTDEGPTSTALTQPDAPAPGAPAPDAMPKWLLPALAVAGAAGVALLVLPMGSSNRGSRARNLDYGSVPSDAYEGRMLRGTLRNLETDAHAMRQMLRDDDDLPQWVHAKVETSADRVSSAQRYLRAKIQAST